MAERLIEDNGGCIGKVERADAIIRGIDEVAADILPSKCLVSARLAAFGLLRRRVSLFGELAGAVLPGGTVGERHLVGQHRNAFAALGIACEQLLGDARALLSENEIVSVAVRGLRMGAARFLG